MYQMKVSKKNPGLIAANLDNSGSTVDSFPGTTDAIYVWIIRFMAIILMELLARCTTVQGGQAVIKPRYYTSFVIYGSKPDFWGDGIQDIEMTVVRYNESSKSFGLNAGSGGTDTEAAFEKTYALLKEAITEERFKDSFPPMVFHLTDGESATDASAAAEKIKFEKLMDEYEKKNVAKQRLLSPIVLHLDKSEMLSFAENKELFFELGFACEVFGDSEVVVRQVPAGFSGEGLNPDLVKEVLYSVSHDKKFKGTKVERVEKLARMACRSSVKAGYEMTLPEIKILVEDLKFSKEPFNCPHGRPTMLRFSWEDLEKRFKRIV